ncbi:M20/M25/M40 family metallo-hydrolase [Belliella aquatica]|uniref:Aminoacyl-histidine dipeptidase n=1 Tax=Belliella aquatica TaxID=1323734 RepID=A0ABQ1M353_9BACT|nr:M20/M25/M40 family metallo-hydrolase [Belliella aquatica]MCH7404817.1 M20/M25/M40 family metallo-hydrolase [Belliella aquatica]GGC33949.1 aminoacyl-histidine dipeptidase [Belliella aquatica]
MKSIKSLLSLALLFLFVQVSAQDIKSTYKAAVEKLANKKEVQDAFAYIFEIDEQTIADMITLTEIPAPSFEETAKGLVFAEMLRNAGADSVWIDEVGNVIALRKGKKSDKTIVIDAHLDTVFPIETDVTVKQRGDTLYAPGIADANRSLAMSIALMKTLVHQNIRTTHDLWFVGSVGEEGLGDLKGMKHLFREGGHKIDAFIAIDGAGIDGIVNGGIGSLRYRVTFKGSGGHSYGAFGIGNPHNALANAISSFVPKADQFTKEGIRTTYSVSVLGGGTSVNSIPYESWMLVDMRSESQERLQGIKKLFLESIEEGLAKENSIIRSGDSLTIDIENVGDRPSGLLESEHPLVQQSMAVANYLTGKQPRLSSSSTNSNVAFSLGIPAVTIGRGGQAGGGHSLDEWFLNKDGYLGLQNALLLILMQGEY